ncbi:polymer-forming cytoskeletal protein [Paenibacillus caui]|uniref:polymer-forming cytoskeletal protein n=1 Tax=Paenibacillus caui TaxID=2873927 RepID=UPI001CA9FAB3|nr:polymer-forming cytoskeletal protein [Paenibacillus caui]
MQERRQRNDLTISGMSTTSGGSYDYVTIDGMAKVTDSLDCLSLEVNGTLKMQGTLTAAERMTINGMGTIEGPVRSSRIRVDGMATLRGDVTGNEVEVNGRCKIEGRLEGERIQIDGSVTVRGNVECENFRANGNLNIEGLLNAEAVDIQLYTLSSVQEIGGERIDVRRTERGGFWKNIGFGGSPRLKAGIIEGDDVFLEDTEADTVRGARVFIGRGCKIRLVEYRETLDQDPEAKVASRRQI